MWHFDRYDLLWVSLAFLVAMTVGTFWPSVACWASFGIVAVMYLAGVGKEVVNEQSTGTDDTEDTREA